MNFNRINNIVGWIVCLIACTVYIMTAEKNGSLWDCGEFVSSCFKLQVPHPPGAPLFTILGRFFIIIFGDNPQSAAMAVNIMSALASGFSILFLFWTITHFARKMVNPDINTITGQQLWSIMGAGVVGGLAYTFSDSFWYSAVEGEVYALSSFFTAIVFWAILKWEHAVDKDARTDAADKTGHTNADRWIVFIFFIMGLSVGVHILNLLTLPAIVMVYYYKRYKVSAWGTLWAFVVGCIITGFVQKFVIQYLIKWAGGFDIAFVNNFNLPFFSGFTFFFVLLAVLIFIGLRVAKQKGWYFLRLGLWSFAFMLIGYSSYLTTMIRSSADPSVDMYNVDNPQSLVGYLSREQYGDFPLLYGQVFTAQPTNYEEGADKYQKGKDKYVVIGKEYKDVYDPSDMMLFPRVWDRSNDQQHADYYAQFLGIEKLQDGTYERKPNVGDNFRFFAGYQTYFMYMRYFLWNFSGKQNDVQGSSPGNIMHGNWITGISFIDNAMYGNQATLPESIKNNKAHNKLFALPLILGLFGLFYQYRKTKQDFLVNMLMFLLTGAAIVFYLNQAGNQPRERDYAYVGSFYAFAVWIGLAVPGFVNMAVNRDQNSLIKILTGIGITFIVLALGGLIGGVPIALPLILIAVLTAAVITGVYFLLQSLKSPGVITKTAVGICLLAAPVLMASQEWDDHDRSNKVLARDLAKDYLESCAPNAILFSFGDNDTYPLWYAQEVEGIRTDVRVINYSLLGIDWYINQMRYKVNDSEPIDVILTADQIEGRNRDYIRLRPGGDQTQYQDLYDIFKNWIGSDSPEKTMGEGEQRLNTFPTTKVSIPVDEAAARATGAINATDTGVADAVRFDLPRQLLMKNDLAVLAVMASTKWKRPVYFTNKFDELGFAAYLRRDGMTYRFVPVANRDVNGDWAYDKMMNKFASGNADKAGVYFDEENRRHLNSIRQAYADLSMYLAAHNKKDSARKALNKVDKMMLEGNMPYGLVSRYGQHNQTSLMLLQAALLSEDKALAQRISTAVRKDLTESMAYFNGLSEKQQGGMQTEMYYTQRLMQMMDQLENSFKQQQQLEGQQKLPPTNADSQPRDGVQPKTP